MGPGEILSGMAVAVLGEGKGAVSGAVRGEMLVWRNKYHYIYMEFSIYIEV